MAFTRGSPICLGENSDFVLPTWSPVTGEGLEPGERAVAKDHLVVPVVLLRLAVDDAWKRYVKMVQGGKPALEVIGTAYGTGRRRSAMAALLARDAGGKGLIQSYAVPDHPPEGRSSYHYRAGFWLKIIHGSERIVRLGAGRCFECGRDLIATHVEGGGEHPRKARVRYCWECWSTSAEIADRDAIGAVFSSLIAALTPGRPEDDDDR